MCVERGVMAQRNTTLKLQGRARHALSRWLAAPDHALLTRWHSLDRCRPREQTWSPKLQRADGRMRHNTRPERAAFERCDARWASRVLKMTHVWMCAAPLLCARRRRKRANSAELLLHRAAPKNRTKRQPRTHTAPFNCTTCIARDAFPRAREAFDARCLLQAQSAAGAQNRAHPSPKKTLCLRRRADRSVPRWLSRDAMSPSSDPASPAWRRRGCCTGGWVCGRCVWCACERCNPRAA